MVQEKLRGEILGRWSKLVKDKFIVKVHYMKHGSARLTLPKPLADLFERPEKIVFEIDEDQRIIIYPK
jgi:hypothetical protein